jgi:hypothetical protein
MIERCVRLEISSRTDKDKKTGMDFYSIYYRQVCRNTGANFPGFVGSFFEITVAKVAPGQFPCADSRGSPAEGHGG